MDRTEALSYIDQNPNFSVLVIGAGINGIGTYRDLALQGLDVLLVERDDFCAGASAASSHMAHGGVRYLENGEFRLVREAVRERNLLIENAPHYVTPLPTVIPMFKLFSGIFNAPLKFLRIMDKPAERGALVIKIGLMVYDAYTGRQGTVPKHEFMLRQKALAEYPRLNPNVLCIARYFDGAISCPERLCVDLLRDVEQSAPHVRAINYLNAISTEAGAVILRDELTGEEHEIHPKLVINAAGPWIDFTNQNLGRQTDFIGGTKGSHLILDHPELHAAIKGKEFFFENDDGRIVLIFPLKDKVLIGTSDLYIENPDEAYCTDEEVDYFIEMIDHVFPDIKVTKEQIVYRFSGVRPLPTSDAATAGQVSRDHSIETLAPEGERKFPIWSLVGGKWTSFRAFAEKVTDMALDFLERDRYQSTSDLPIGGGAGYPRTEETREAWLMELHNQSGLPLPRLETLLDRYGTRAAEIARFAAAGKDSPFADLPSYSRYEIAYLTRQEMIVHLDDLLLRRSLLAMLGQLSHPLLGELADVVGEELGWSDEQKDAELQRTLEILEKRHGARLA